MSSGRRQCVNSASRINAPVLYASLKAVHLLSVIVWVGGMFFMLFCLRPAAALLEPPERVRLMHAAMRRFFAAVAVAALLVLASGAAMIGMAERAARGSGLAFNMPLDWYAMAGIFVVMAAVFAHIRLVLFARLARAVAAQMWPAAAIVIGAIRLEVVVNLVLGAFVVVLVLLGGAT